MNAPVPAKLIDSAARLTRNQWAELRTKTGRTTQPITNIDDLDSDGVFLGYQRSLISSTAKNQVTVVEKSRRTGATWALAADAVLTSATSKNDGGMDTLYIGYNLDMAREFIDTAADWARQFHAVLCEIEEFIFKGKDADGGDKDILAFRINFASGFEIVALTSNPRSLRGRQGFVIIDEAAFHDAFKELLKAAMALLIWGGKVCVISTHDGEDNAYNVLVNDIRSGRSPYALIRFDFDDAIKDGLYERVCVRRGLVWTPEGEADWREQIIAFYGDGADEELYCVPSKGSGTFMPSALIRSRMADIPVLRKECDADFVHLPDADRIAAINDWLEEYVAPVLANLDPDLRHCFGSDFGRVADLTVLWPFAIQRTMNLKTPFVIELRNVPFEQQKQIFFYVLDSLPFLSSGALDGGGNGAYLAEVVQQQYGAHCIEIIHFTQGFYRENFPRLKAAFEDEGLNIPRDDDTHNDFRAIRMLRGVPQVPSDKRTVELASKGRKRHGDSALAALLAHYASEMDVAIYAYETAITDPADDNDDDLGDPTLFNTRSDGVF
ncbi:MAG: terminase family protein [Cohaesibacteraceae bacterium]|nr:terminase family protein [Cohaesibacteraceae bacterium]MBL4877055.1 terminase family protein [Cohaesibacteraceae bacterium]